MSAEFFKWWGLDLQTGEFRVELRSGEEIRRQVELDDAMRSANIAKAVYDWDQNLIALITTRDDIVFFEPFAPAACDPKGGRTVVYLDQNHWSTLALALSDPRAVAKQSEVAPALRLLELAEDYGVILPLSSGHLRETSPLTGDKRYRLGLAMAKASAGWQMLHPASVWRDEHLRMVASEVGVGAPPSAARPVFTLESRAILGGSGASLSDLDDMQLFVMRVSSPQTLLEVLLDPSTRASLVAETLVASFQNVTDAIAGSTVSKAQRRTVALEQVWSQPSADEAASTLGVAPLSLRPSEHRRLLASQPFTSYYSSLVAQRLTSSTLWTVNDLVDLAFLCCATGYADYVVAEVATGTQLAQLQKSRRVPQTVHLTLESLVSALDDAGVMTDTERARAGD